MHFCISESESRAMSTAKSEQKILGRHIVVDLQICHSKPIFRGMRIMFADVLEMVANGMAWESIVDEYDGHITKDAVGEAVKLASGSFIKHAHENALELTPA